MIRPECGMDMDPGFIWTNGPYLYWAEKTNFYVDGERLECDSWTRGARLPALRCLGCKLSMAKYESYGASLKYEE